MKSGSTSRILLSLVATLVLSSISCAEVLKIVVNDTIQPITEEYIARAIDEAQRRNDQAVLMEINTPGGLVESTRHIIEKITSSQVPVILYVAPSGSRAGSAGIFILEAADVAAMAPGTNAGAAHPVLLFGPNQVKTDDEMKQKIENDAAALMRSVVSRRGRNVELAESAVRESKSFTDQEALAQHLIDYIASSEEDLFRQLDGKSFKRFNGQEVTLKLSGQPIAPFGMTIKEQILGYLMDPNLAFILLAIGALALYAEFNHPGAVVPGTVDALCRAGPDSRRIRTLRRRSQVCQPRRPHGRRHRAAHSWRIASRRFAHPGNARTPADRTRRQHSARIDHRIPHEHRHQSPP
ncbi:MAG: ATP-dependent Clp protease proteolytic subunit [Candidatus Sulfotelmatobacter sp.]